MNIRYCEQVAERLRNFNAWRRGEDDRILQPHPAQIGQDIDTAVKLIDAVTGFLSDVKQEGKGDVKNGV